MVELEIVKAVLRAQPYLTIAGFRAPFNTGCGGVDPRRTPDAFKLERAELLTDDGQRQIQAALEYIVKLRRAKITEESKSSYGLKHYAENFHNRETYKHYISNGALIVAALLESRPIERRRETDINCLVGVNTQDVAALNAGVDPLTLRARPSSFVRWLFAQADRNDATGCLAYDSKDDLHFPRTNNADAVRYLLRFGLDDELSEAIREYNAQTGKKLDMETLAQQKESNTPNNPKCYFVQSGESGPIKIGFTKTSVEKRMASLQTAHPEPLRLLLCLDGDRDLESALHQRFAHARKTGEWFEPVSDLKLFIASKNGEK